MYGGHTDHLKFMLDTFFESFTIAVKGITYKRHVITVHE
jgi:hypothetical protein